MPLEFWFEFASTYSYLTVMRIEQVTAQAEVEVLWKPFLLGPIFATQGWNDSPFNIYPAKGSYMWRDMERRAARYGLPFRRPSQFPRRSLLAARVAILAARQGWCPEFTKRVFPQTLPKIKTLEIVLFLKRCLVRCSKTEKQFANRLNLQTSRTPYANKRKKPKSVEFSAHQVSWLGPNFSGEMIASKTQYNGQSTRAEQKSENA